MALAFPDWSSSHIWGGPEFDSAEYIISLTNDMICWETENDFPSDARYWVHSLPILPFGDGDYAGLYVRDNPVNPPVAYLCHDGCGASGIIAPDFDAFLTVWGQLGYFGLYLFRSFINPRTGLIDPDALPSETGAIRCLLRGEVRSDLVKTPSTMTGTEWDAFRNPDMMLKWLEAKGMLDERRVRPFACACCRRVWDRLSQSDRGAVEVAERFADGAAGEADLKAARTALVGGKRGEQLLREMDASLGKFGAPAGAEPSAERVDPRGDDPFMAAFNESVRFSKSQGVMHHAALAAVDGSWLVSWEITQHLDEPELTQESSGACGPHSTLLRESVSLTGASSEGPSNRGIKNR